MTTGSVWSCALWAGLIAGSAGCRHAAPADPVAVARPAPRRGTVNLARYLELHPAFGELARLDARIAALERPAPAGSAPPPWPVPEPVPLPDSAPPAVPLPAPATAQERTARETREEFSLLREAVPDRAEGEYVRDVERLRRRYLELRDLPAEEDLEQELRRSGVYAEQATQLQRQTDALVERPSDRFRYPAEQLARRRELLLETQERLDQLRTAELDRQRKRLEPPVRRPLQIPPARLEEAAARRDAARREAAQQLDAAERTRLHDAARLTLPELPPAAPLVEEESAGGPPTVTLPTAEVRRPAGSARAAGGAPAHLRSQQARLRQIILEDLAAAAAQAARARGWQVLPAPGDGPDLTAALEPDLRRLLAEPRQTAEGVIGWRKPPGG